MKKEIYDLAVAYIRAYYKYQKLYELKKQKLLSCQNALSWSKGAAVDYDYKLVELASLGDVIKNSFNLLENLNELEKDIVNNISTGHLFFNRWDNNFFFKEKLSFIEKVAAELTSKELLKINE